MRPVLSIGVAVLSVFVAIAAEGAVSATDDRGRTVTLDRPATRIVSLAPHLTELLFAAGAGVSVVGVSAYSDYPPAARQLPEVGNAVRADLERLVMLHPDLVVVWESGTAQRDVERLEALGFPVFVHGPRRLADVAVALRGIARLTGTGEVAERAAGDFEEGLRALRGTFGDRRKLRVFFQISDRPLMTISGGHMINDVLALCGGENVFAQRTLLTPQVTIEDLAVADPDVILISAPRGQADAATRRWLEMPLLRSARAGDVYIVPPDLILRPTPRVLDGARVVCTRLDEVRARTGVTRGSP